MRRRLERLCHPLAAPLLAMVAAVAYCAVQEGCRLLTPDRQGYRAFQNSDYGLAVERFADPQWRAAALYRRGEFKQAAGILAGFDSAEGAFNHGNALLMQGLYQQAAERYARALELQPEWQAALGNREIALSRAKALEKEGADMSGGMLGADEIVFSAGKPPPSTSDEQTEPVQGAAGDAELRALWLRQVQTRPADFLRAKFAHQRATREAGGE